MDGNEDILADAAAISGKELTLQLASGAAGSGQTVRVAYDNVFAVDSGGLFTDAAGNAVPWGEDSGDFSISSGGALTFKTPPDSKSPADANRDNVYRVTIQASNGTSTGTLLDVRITVLEYWTKKSVLPRPRRHHHLHSLRSRLP